MQETPTTTGITEVDMSIVLVCWNNRAYLEPCLHSIYDSGIRSRFDVVVVDNDSADGSQEMLRAQFPQVQLVQNDRNVGLGRASNQGIQATAGRYVLLLNNDTLVNASSLDNMVEFMDTHPETGAVGGQLLNPGGSLQSSYVDFSSLMQEFLIASGLGGLFRPNYPSHGADPNMQEVDWLSSACLMLRRSALDQVGLLDEEYFIYGDETDLCYRLKQAGWKVYYLPNVTTIHYGGRSMDRWRRRRMVYRGKLLFFKKHYGPLRTIILRVMLAGLSVGKMLVWGLAWIFPHHRERACNELKSNLDVVRLCVNLR